VAWHLPGIPRESVPEPGQTRGTVPRPPALSRYAQSLPRALLAQGKVVRSRAAADGAGPGAHPRRGRPRCRIPGGCPARRPGSVAGPGSRADRLGPADLGQGQARLPDREEELGIMAAAGRRVTPRRLPVRHPDRGDPRLGRLPPGPRPAVQERGLPGAAGRAATDTRARRVPRHRHRHHRRPERHQHRLRRPGHSGGAKGPRQVRVHRARTRDLLLRRQFRNVPGRCWVWPDVPFRWSDNGW
jgi:hypothetical protein